jgi:hypothetical protein
MSRSSYSPIWKSSSRPLEECQAQDGRRGGLRHAYRYTDPEYGTEFALKRAKRGLDEKDLTRFRKEFELLKKLRFPYVLEVYQYNANRDEYTMEVL